MKKFKFLSMAFMALMMAASFTACSKDDDLTPVEPEPPVEDIADYRFELYVCPVKHGGMSMNKNGTFVRSVTSLNADQPMVQFTRKGYELTNYENTISEKAFWMYFVPKIIRTYYYKKIQEDTSMDSPWWKAITILIQDLYCLCKPAFCDNILDDGNNIVNFSMSNEVAVVRVNVEYGYDTTG
jgi:hypothetical protein